MSPKSLTSIDGGLSDEDDAWWVVGRKALLGETKADATNGRHTAVDQRNNIGILGSWCRSNRKEDMRRQRQDLHMGSANDGVTMSQRIGMLAVGWRNEAIGFALASRRVV